MTTMASASLTAGDRSRRDDEVHGVDRQTGTGGGQGGGEAKPSTTLTAGSGGRLGNSNGAGGNAAPADQAGNHFQNGSVHRTDR